ncbi:hypothetical protein LJC00_02285 [Dysgonomonas sp. OttesenSCG-928-M03]|nr:hypothetical protein [Dysgonomonas sp. OttesenSCG-928-M03]
MKIEKYIRITFVTILLLSTVYVYPQVTIGSTNTSAKGAVLDIKEIEPIAGNTDPLKNKTSESGGIVLPRVKLQSLSTLSPFVSTPGNATTKKNHVGLVVYNIRTSVPDSLVPGVYVWDGEKWKLLIAGEISNSPWFKVGTTSSSKTNLDDSYLSAKAVVGGTTIAKVNGTADAQLTVTGADASINTVTVGQGKSGATNTGNTAVGNSALSSNTSTANRNTAIGAKALPGNTSGSGNTSFGGNTLSQSTSASNNIAIGANSGNLLTTESDNILIGANTQASSVSTTKINIANTVFGAPGATPALGKVGIGTDAPAATLHVGGNMKYTNSSPISGGRVLVRNNTTGKIGRVLVAPRLFAAVDSKSSQTNLGTKVNTSMAVVEWAESDFSKKDVAEISLGSNNQELIYIKDRKGWYEVSAYVSYNPAATLPSSYPTSLSVAQQNWLIVLNVLVQKCPAGTSTWETISGTQVTWTGSVLGIAKLITVPHIAVSLSTGDKLRLVLTKPSGLGMQHASTASIEPLVPNFGFTKGFKITNL